MVEVGVSVTVSVAVTVGVSVLVTVEVSVGVGGTVSVKVTVGLGVSVTVWVDVGDSVGEGVLEGVAERVTVGVGVGSKELPLALPGVARLLRRSLFSFIAVRNPMGVTQTRMFKATRPELLHGKSSSIFSRDSPSVQRSG